VDFINHSIICILLKLDKASPILDDVQDQDQDNDPASVVLMEIFYYPRNFTILKDCRTNADRSNCLNTLHVCELSYERRMGISHIGVHSQ